ncbi:aspartyl protease family protein [uncultured Tenacibaculum sp.]|uniref:aspartyl protease family protein n=1 Tax=uncultured Tenacibaculum sp. TaxID=174713 RepID=UPI00261D0CD1|nr:aspartyl protease family protein [uncultured Tenacibaculum sp.]
MKKVLLLSLLFFSLHNVFTQGRFQFFGKNDVKQKVKFERINNLIVIPLEINGKELSFILDTGVNKTILFNLTENDSLGLNNVEKIKLQGLGDNEPVDALLSKNNRFKIKNIVNSNEDLYVILKDNFNMSSKMGTTIHGIIGFDLLRDVILKVDYSNRMLTFYNPKKYKLRKCGSCEVFPLEFYRSKPYINTYTQLDTVSDKKIKTKLLVDSGGSDAIWLFEGTHSDIKTPKKFFKDILGEGLNGSIYGNRSRVPAFHLGKFTIPEPTVSFLDTTSTVIARQFTKRNGSIGGNILKRFKVWFDYPNRRMMLKKNGSLKKGFYYNMSGIVVVYSGKDLIKEEVQKTSVDSYGIENKSSSSDVFSFVTTYKYQFKSAYKILEIIEDSPAFKVGMEKGDLIKRINGKPAHEYSLDDINGIFSYKPGRRVIIEVERDGLPLKFKFKLEKRI